MSAPLILATNSIKDTGYNVDNSLRFEDASSGRALAVFIATWISLHASLRRNGEIPGPIVSWCLRP